mgnify:CR=1 FL=1
MDEKNHSCKPPALRDKIPGMSRKWLLLLLPVIALLWDIPLLSAQDEVGDLLGRINSLRASQGLPGYSVSSALTVAAQQQAQWIVETGSVSHTRPDGSGPRTRAVGAGYPSTEVSENIYGGTMATADTAWTFWVNSAIHYNGFVHRRYREIGIGVARGGWGAAYVTVFGNPGGEPPFVPQANNVAASSGGGGGGNPAAAAPAAPPSFVVGTDARGNIMHSVQPGDTLGDIALIYGYTWDDLPYMMLLNGLTDVQDLEVGSIFLVPPRDGTFTPVPWDAGPTQTPAATAPPTLTPYPTARGMPTATPYAVATAMYPPDALVQDANPVAVPLVVAVPTQVDPTPGTAVPQIAGVTITRSTPSPWLGVALVVQVGILVGAGVEFVRRSRRRKDR